MVNIRLKLPFSFQIIAKAPLIIDTIGEIDRGLLKLGDKTDPKVVALINRGLELKNIVLLVDGIPYNDKTPELSNSQEVTIIPTFGEEQGNDNDETAKS